MFYRSLEVPPPSLQITSFNTDNLIVLSNSSLLLISLNHNDFLICLPTLGLYLNLYFYPIVQSFLIYLMNYLSHLVDRFVNSFLFHCSYLGLFKVYLVSEISLFSYFQYLILYSLESYDFSRVKDFVSISGLRCFLF